MQEALAFPFPVLGTTVHRCHARLPDIYYPRTIEKRARYGASQRRTIPQDTLPNVLRFMMCGLGRAHALALSPAIIRARVRASSVPTVWLGPDVTAVSMDTGVIRLLGASSI